MQAFCRNKVFFERLDRSLLFLQIGREFATIGNRFFVRFGFGFQLSTQIIRRVAVQSNLCGQLFDLLFQVDVCFGKALAFCRDRCDPFGGDA